MTGPGEARGLSPAHSRKRAIRRLALALVALGALLLVFKVVVDSEPGVLPLGLLLVGAVTWLLARPERSSGQ